MKKIIPLLVLILIFSVTSLTHAQVQTRLRIIQASNIGKTVDPSLRDLHNDLGTLFSFSSYRLLKDETLSLSLNIPVSFQVHKGRSIEITQTGLHRNIAEIRVRIIREGTDILNTQVRLSPGKTVLIGGPKHGEGVAILALSTRF